MIGEQAGFKRVRVGGRELMLPSGATPRFVCTVPVAAGEVCGKAFMEHERSAFEHHVLQCLKAHAAVIHEEKPSEKHEIFNGIWDKDLAKWMEKHHDALIEGRKRL